MNFAVLSDPETVSLYPLTLYELRGYLTQTYPNVSWPAVLDAEQLQAYGIVNVSTVDPPNVELGVQVTEQTPVFNPQTQHWEQSYSTQPPDLATLKALKKEQITAARYNNETQGVQYPYTVNGTTENLTIQTDPVSQGKLQAVYSLSTNGLWDDVNGVWKFNNGVFKHITTQQINEMVALTVSFVEACFQQEKAYYDVIDQAQTLEEVYQVTWNPIT